MKILITGATGYLGNYVIEELVKSKHQIIASANNTTKAEQKQWHKKVTFIQHNINDTTQQNLFQKFLSPDKIIHLAWEGLPNFSDSIHYEKVLVNQFWFLKNLIINGAKHLCITGTCFEYGMQSNQLNEDLPTTPNTAYGLAKDTLRKFLEDLQKTNTFILQWLRLFYMHGEKGDEQYEKAIIPQLQKAINNKEKTFKMSGGKQLRDYLKVQKMANYIIAIANQTKHNGAINVCSGQPINIENLVKNYLIETQQQIDLELGHYPYTTYEPMNFWGDNKKLLQIINDTKNA